MKVAIFMEIYCFHDQTSVTVNMEIGFFRNVGTDLATSLTPRRE